MARINKISFIRIFTSLIIIVSTYLLIGNLCTAEKVTYISIEHTIIESYNLKYFDYANISSFRYGRRSPVYYMNMYFKSKVPLDNNLLISFYFYQWLSNRYHRSFVEMHMKFCDLINKDLFFGAAMRQGLLSGPCPYKAGVYDFYNMTVLPEAIPQGFPFTKGRIICNVTLVSTKELVGWGHGDMELKTLKVTARKPKEKL